MHGYPVHRIINSGDEVFDINFGVLQTMVQSKCAVLAAAAVEY